MKIILTGATGYVGEGVMLELLRTPQVEKVLSVGRRPVRIDDYPLSESEKAKLEEYIIHCVTCMVAALLPLPTN